MKTLNGALICALLLASLAAAQFEEDAELGGMDLEDLFSEPANDELLAGSFYTDIADWPGVAKDGDAAAGEALWQVVQRKEWRRFAAVSSGTSLPMRRLASPRQAGASLRISLAVPTGATYRVWLSYVAAPEKKQVVTATFAGATKAQHEFGAAAMPRQKGATLEKQFPIHFDSSRDALNFGVVGTDAMLWEHWDLELAAGPTTLSLTAASTEAELDAVFISRNLGFRPSKAMYEPGEAENASTLHRLYFRFRLLAADDQAARAEVTSFVHYMSPHFRRNSEERIWYSSVMKSSTLPIPNEAGQPYLQVGQQGQWLDVTEVVSGRGDPAVNHLTIKGPASGRLALDMAWYPHDAAVVRTIELPVAEGKSMHMFPVDSYCCPTPAPDDAGIWGVVAADYAAQLEAESDALQRVIALMSSDEIEDCPPLKRIRLYTGCRVSPSCYPVAVPALTRLGINSLGGVPFAESEKYGLRESRVLYQQGSEVHSRNHSPLDPTFETWARGWAEETAETLAAADPQARERQHYLKMGDEIGPITRPAMINGLTDCRRAFHDYLQQQLPAGTDCADFFGAADLDAVDFSLDRTPDMGRYARRAYYHSAHFNWVLTARYYARFTRAAQTVFPNVLTGCNHTPGSFMFGGDMTSSNWFALARYGGSNSALAEGWVRTRGRYAFAGTQTISYYAEILDCAARPGQLPKWFYLVGGCGEIDRKLLCLVARGIQMIHLYDWGPSYVNADGFSHAAWTYPQINRGARAIAPAEDMIVDGSPLPRRAAIVYNRTDEIWNSGNYGLYVDRLFVFLALQHSHRPVDIILDSDLTADVLSRYRIVYLDGFNLPKAAIAPLSDWVEAGGVLYATAGSAMRDEYDDPLPESAELFGASQQLQAVSTSSWYYSQWWPIGLRQHTAIDKITVQETELTPAVSIDVVGVKTVITPAAATPIATYSDGSCAGVMRQLGNGKVLLLGVGPGHLYCHNAPLDWEEPYEHPHPVNYTADRRELIAKAATAALGPPPVQYSEPLVEVNAFSHPRGMAILLSDFSYDTGRPGKLSVASDREVEGVSSTMRGELTWHRADGRIVIDVAVPEPVDVVVLELQPD